MSAGGQTRGKAKVVRHVGFLRHGGFRWFIVAVLLCAAAVWGYRRFEPDPPSGGSWYGYGLGTVAALMILWLAYLGVRKRSITPGTWTLKGWVSAHVYLGLALALIATLHTAFQFGWNLHTLFYALMLLVIASGLVGVILYVAMPRVLSANRAELTERQMLEQIEALDQQLHEAALPLSAEAAEAVRGSIRNSAIGGLVFSCGTARAIRIVDRLQLDTVAALLAKKSEALARARRHARIKATLQAWLYIHVPATFAVLAAMVAHIVAVFFYA